MTRVMVCILHQGWIRHELAGWLYAVLAQETRYAIEACFSGIIPTIGNRNAIARAFLDSQNDYLFMVDDDMQLLTNPLDLVARDLDVVGCPYLLWDTELGDLRSAVGGECAPAIGDVVEVEAMGTGAILIARRVLEHPAMVKPFTYCYNEHGEVTVSEDVHFCRRARAAGFRVYAARRYSCDHYKTVALSDVLTLRQYGKGRGSGKL